jgi:hypothetical protein
MLDLKLLTLIINEVGKLTLRRDKQHYRLELSIKAKDLRVQSLDELVIDIKLDYLFDYFHSTKSYHLYNNRLVALLEQLDSCTYLLNEYNYKKIKHILTNKQLFTRHGGQRLTAEELNTLEQLYLEFKELHD